MPCLPIVSGRRPEVQLQLPEPEVTEFIHEAIEHGVRGGRVNTITTVGSQVVTLVDVLGRGRGEGWRGE
jgi:urease gamma subunit